MKYHENTPNFEQTYSLVRTDEWKSNLYMHFRARLQRTQVISQASLEGERTKRQEERAGEKSRGRKMNTQSTQWVSDQ